MSYRTPIIRQISWRQSLPQVVILAGIIVISTFLLKDTTSIYNAIMLGAGVYLLFSFSSRYLIPGAHRRGIRMLRNHNYSDAIEEFEKSYEFFSRHPWIDQLRSIILLSSSAVGYREMALLNIAFCCSQIDQAKKAKEYYQRVLNEFPESGIATAALKMIDSVEKGLQP